MRIELIKTMLFKTQKLQSIKKTQVNSLLQRIANGESGVVLEEIL